MKTEKCIFLLRILCRVHLWLIQWTLRLGQFFVNLFRNCLQEDSELIVKLRSCFDMLNDENIFFHWPNCSFYLKAKGISGGSVVKNPPDNEEDTGLILGWEDPLMKEMAIHYSIIVWKILWTVELGRLQFMGSLNIWTQIGEPKLVTKQQQRRAFLPWTQNVFLRQN